MSRSEHARTIERAAAAEAVLSLLRHETRNKLASMRNALFYLRRRLAGAEEWQADSRVPAFFDLVEQELSAAEALLRENSHLRSLLRSEEVAVEQILRDVVERAKLGDGIAVDLDLDPSTTITADPDELALAVESLLWNAVEALHSGSGRIELRARRPSDAEIIVEVRDNGVGVDVDVLSPAEAMRALSTTKPGRAGLGLAIARRFASRLRGSLSLTREDGWTIARITVPMEGSR